MLVVCERTLRKIQATKGEEDHEGLKASQHISPSPRGVAPPMFRGCPPSIWDPSKRTTDMDNLPMG
jgi:hypothetical protein